MTWWPGWNSAESASTWAHIWFWFGMWCFLWLGISEVIAFVYGLRKDALVEVAQQAAAIQAQQDKEALQGQLVDANKKVAKLELRNIPRRLSAADKAALIQDLSHSPGQKAKIVCLTVAWDCADYGNDFLEVFRQAKWDVPDPVFTAIMIGRDPIGLEVVVNPEVIAKPQDVPGDFADSIIYLGKAAMRLGQMLGPNPTVTPDDSVPYGTVELRIGRIPPPK